MGVWSGKWQAALCPSAKGRSKGSSSAQRSCANGQRVRNRQPLGGDMAEGSSPFTAATRLAHRRVGDRDGVYQALGVGVSGVRVQLFGGPISTNLPRYMTPIVSARYFTTARSWEMTM